MTDPRPRRAPGDGTRRPRPPDHGAGSAPAGGGPLRRVGERARRSPSYRWWVLWVVLAGLLGTNLLFTVFVVALERVHTELHTSVATITWVVTGPMLAFGVVAPLAGRAGDVWGHRRLYLLGVVAETVAAVLSATAPNATVLIAARTFSGAVGAAIGAASMALVLSVFDKGERVKALGFWSMVGAGGPVLGVAIGGPVIQLLGWRWLFVLQLPILAVALALAAAILPERATPADRAAGGPTRMDWAGAATVAVAVAAFLFALNRGPGSGWTSPLVLGSFAVAALAAAAFVPCERRAPDPLFPLHYARKRNFVFPIAAQAGSNFAYLGAFFLAPLLLENVYHYSEAAVGFLSLPRPIVFSALAPVAGYIAVRIGERTTAVVGTAAIAASMGIFALTSASGGLLLVELALVLSGIGLGFAQPPLSATVANEFSADDLGTASASQQLANQMGTVAGIQVMQTVQASVAHRAPLLTSFHAAYLVGGGVALLAVVAAALMRSTERTPVAAVDLHEAMDASERPPIVPGEIGDVVGGEVIGAATDRRAGGAIR